MSGVSALIVLTLGLAGDALAACPVEPTALARDLDHASASYLDLDLDGFTGRFDAIRAELDCLTGTLDSAQAAKLHYAFALRAFLDRDQDRMLRAVRGVLAADPTFAPSPEVARPGNGLFIAFELAAHRREPITIPLPEGRWVVDGQVAATEVPIDGNAVVQRVDIEPIATWYVDAPALPAGLAPAQSDPLPSIQARKRRSVPLLLAGLGVGVASGAALGTAAVLKDRYYDEEDPPRNPERVRTWNQVTGVSGWALAAGAAGLGVGAVATWSW